MRGRYGDCNYDHGCGADPAFNSRDYRGIHDVKEKEKKDQRRSVRDLRPEEGMTWARSKRTGKSGSLQGYVP